METPNFSSCSRTRVSEGLRKGTDPRGMTAEGVRQILDTPCQPSACGENISRLEALYLGVTGKLAWMEKEISKKRVWSDSVDTRLQFLESWYRQHAASDHYKTQETSNPDPPYKKGHGSHREVFPERVIQKESLEKEEYKKLKEKIKELEARNQELLSRNQELLSKAMGMHKDSENMNEPSRLSTTLQMYEMLRLRDWEKLRSSTASYLSYKTGSSMIKKLFDACEKDIQQRITNIFKVLDIPPSNDTMTNSKQGMMQEIRHLFRYSYYQNHSEFYNNIITDPPVKAMWSTQESLMQDVEHVDMKDCEHWINPAFLWPVMKCGEQVIVKGVVWDEK